jgi:hypothetical protein
MQNNISNKIKIISGLRLSYFDNNAIYFRAEPRVNIVYNLKNYTKKVIFCFVLMIPFNITESPIDRPSSKSKMKTNSICILTEDLIIEVTNSNNREDLRSLSQLDLHLSYENSYNSSIMRVSTIAGDMFKENLPKNFDIHFYSNVFHDWTQDQIIELLKKSYGSLNNNGIVIINDLHLNNDKQSPDFAIDHSLYLSIFTEGKCYSYKEIENMIKRVGFKRVKIEKPIAGYSVIIGYK